MYIECFATYTWLHWCIWLWQESCSGCWKFSCFCIRIGYNTCITWHCCCICWEGIWSDWTWTACGCF
nr:hypothetical protein Iba_chr03cCG11940 [Ipomoea batatas]GMD75393.1 hypothetical protein Iba_scaffold1545050CG0010 [Ipomoea batatas]GME00750.1 hypothetical protein Iba_scaffold461435CG0010 [Ipomoea batatas]GME20320.1 hypothetical protein Iba_scaffold24837CG0020 [Ipomoea batatas]